MPTDEKRGRSSLIDFFTRDLGRKRAPQKELRPLLLPAWQVLVDALDAWKDGKANSLAKHDPPIRFVDDDWAAGWQLADYEFDTPDVSIRPFADVQVNLTLQNRQGKTIEKTAAYQIALTPALSVLRSDP
jgi:hypothetical protein